MPSPNEGDAIRITTEDLAGVVIAEPAVSVPTAPSSGAKVYGTINQTAEQFVTVPTERASLLLQGWFYLGLAGMLGATAGWAIAESGFADGPAAPAHAHWGNIIIFPLIITLMCIGFGVSESIVERSVRKALLRGALALPLGILLGFIFDMMAESIYAIGMRLAYEAGAQSMRNPALWIVRGVGWTVFGAAGGVVYGIVGQSTKKGTYGVLGGALGAGLGGLIFNPIAIATHAGGVSRAVGFGLLGLATGVGMGLVESALKDRWLYVVAGPLAGKQFILYKTETNIGSRQESDIYLFKDPNILPCHASISISGARVMLRATGSVLWAGQPVHERVLQDGDLLQLGRYAFRYKEKHRA
ncbi:MAG TPA: FHA domain-containing protein [Candidatus Acidoferrales bacterium]|nr:FHA domain-containing protein [Candidatus Acidoferrales bacterium]